jgi:hypothetical protein
MSSLFGTLEFAHLNIESSSRHNPYSLQMTNGYNDSKSEDEDYVFINSSNKIEQISPPLSTSISNVQKKRVLWQIDYFSVPYYVRTYENHLFICDKYGLNSQII